MKGFLKRIDDSLFGRLHNHYAHELEKQCIGYESLLDVACGSDSPVKYFSSKIKRVVGIDIFEPSIEKSRAAGIHTEYRKMNVLDLEKEFGLKAFDVVVASDLIEHLEKPDGFKLIEQMEKVAKKKVVIYTPNGFLEQREYDGNKYQVHLSGWEVEEMEKLGYKVYGINGAKWLRGEFAVIKWWPKVFWGRISLLTQKRTFTRPKKAFGILCVKEIN